MFNRILDTIKSRMAIILAVTVIAGMAAFAGIHEYNRVYHICSTEAGVTVRAKDFLKNESDGGYFTVDSDLVDQSVPGEYVLKLKTGWFVHKCILKITDTIPPTGETKSVSVEINQNAMPMSLWRVLRMLHRYRCPTRRSRIFQGEETGSNGSADGCRGNTTELASEVFISQVVEELYVEAGSRMPTLSDFVLEGEKAEFKTQMRSINYNKPSEKTVKIQVDGLIYESQMHIVDTTPPEVQLHSISGYTLLPREPEDFVTSIDDVTEVDVFTLRSRI